MLANLKKRIGKNKLMTRILDSFVSFVVCCRFAEKYLPLYVKIALSGKYATEQVRGVPRPLKHNQKINSCWKTIEL